MAEDSQSDNLTTKPYPQSDDLNKTKPYETERVSEETQLYGSDDTDGNNTRLNSQNATEQYPSNYEVSKDPERTYNLLPKSSIILNDKNYDVIEIISEKGKTAEAAIYKIKDADEKIFALKLYKYFEDKRREPNQDALKIIKELNEPSILKLHAYGTGTKKFKDRYCFEICDFAEGGNLVQVPNLKSKYSLDFIESHVVPSIFKAIKRLHENNIIHCDLKPHNIFYRDKAQMELVIGDYGSSKTIEVYRDDEKEPINITTFPFGTQFYLPPEMAFGVIEQKNDYYSLGMTIFHLLYDEHVNKETHNQIRKRQARRKQMFDYNPEFGRLNDLIAGLTLPDPTLRWGKKELEVWLSGGTPKVLYQHIGEVALPPIQLDRITIHDLDELFAFIEKDSQWYKDLIEDEIVLRHIVGWVFTLKGQAAKNEFNEMIMYYQQDKLNYVKEALIRYFRPDRSFKVMNKCFNFYSSENVVRESQQFYQSLDDLPSPKNLTDVKLKLFQWEFSIRQLERDGASDKLKPILRAMLDKAASTFGLSPRMDFIDYKTDFYPKLTDEILVDLFHAFIPDRGFKDDSNTYHISLEKMGLYFAGHKNNFNSRYGKLERDAYCRKLNREDLCKMKYNEFIFSIFKSHVRSNVQFVDTEYITRDSHGIRIIYKFGRSLSAYLKENDVNVELAESSSSRNVVDINEKLESSVSSISSCCFREIAKKQNVNEEYIDSVAKEKFINDLAKKQNEYLQKEKLRDIVYAFSSANKLLPVYVLILLFIGFVLNGTPVLRILQPYSPFPLLKESLFQANSFAPRAETLGGINIVLLLSFIPGVVLAWAFDLFGRSRRFETSCWILGILLIVGPFVFGGLAILNTLLANVLILAGMACIIWNVVEQFLVEPFRRLPFNIASGASLLIMGILIALLI